MSASNLELARVAIESASSRDELCDTLNEVDDETMGLIDTSSLPTYMGAEPRETEGVWSWDETRLLTTDCNGVYIIEPRCECGEATFHCLCDEI